MPGIERRSFLLGATGALIFGGTALAAKQPGQTLDLADPAQALTALMRMQGGLNRDAPWWYFGRIYGVLPGLAPIPLVRFEGLEIQRFASAVGGEFPVTGVTTSFFLDWQSKERLQTFANPVSKRLNQVKPNLIGGSAGRVAAFYSKRGVRPGRTPAEDWKGEGLHLSWDYYEDTVWLSHDRSYPPGLPQPMGESSVVRARIADLHDVERDFVPAGFSSTYFAPWPAWMDMEGQPGHVIWHADGLKLESVAKLPARFRSWMDQLFPERLAAPAYSPPAAGG